jgi:hypothetical protein
MNVIADFASDGVLYFLSRMEKEIQNRKRRVVVKRQNAIESAVAAIEAIESVEYFSRRYRDICSHNGTL